jgi:phytoene/squalene synthetase
MAAAGADTAMLFALKSDDALSRVARPIAERARAHIDAARILRHAVPGKARAAVLPLVLAEAYLRRMARNKFDPFADTAMSALSRQARLAVAAIRRRY